VFSKQGQCEGQGDDKAASPVQRNTPYSNLLDVRVDAFPKDAFCVDSAQKELQHKFPVANTEGDATRTVKDIEFAFFRVIESVLYSIEQCRSSKAGAQYD
jgi:hypothetical protein